MYDVKRETDWNTPVQSSAGMAGGHTDPVWYDSPMSILLNSKQNAKFSNLQDENRLIFVVLSGRFQNLF